MPVVFMPTPTAHNRSRAQTESSSLLSLDTLGDFYDSIEFSDDDVAHHPCLPHARMLERCRHHTVVLVLVVTVVVILLGVVGISSSSIAGGYGGFDSQFLRGSEMRALQRNLASLVTTVRGGSNG